MKNLSIQIKAIIDKHLEKTRETIHIGHKDDGSIVSTADIQIQKDLILFFKSYLNQNVVYIGEEGFENSQLESIDKNFCIIDPIDGTENFVSGLPIYGSTISLILKDFEYHCIYIPSENKLIDSYNIDDVCVRAFESEIALYSTKCLNQNFKNIDNARVMGSSSYMFYLFLTKQVKSYTYCEGAKVWDCYTGIALANKMGAKIEMKSDLQKWLKSPEFKTEFHLNWDD